MLWQLNLADFSCPLKEGSTLFSLLRKFLIHYTVSIWNAGEVTRAPWVH